MEYSFIIWALAVVSYQPPCGFEDKVNEETLNSIILPFSYQINYVNIVKKISAQ
jgi:hypothetical protein